jgi:transposase
MEQRAVIRFLTFNGIRASAIAAELKSVCETEGLTLSTVKKWLKRLAEGRTSLYDDPKCGRPLPDDSAEAVSSMLKERPHLSCKVLHQHFRIAWGTCL